MKAAKFKKTIAWIGGHLHVGMAFPALALFLAFVLLPLAFSVFFSFTSWNGLGKASFIGFDNFVSFFQDDRAQNAVKNSLVFAFCSVPLLNILGLSYALLLDRTTVLSKIVKAIVYVPAVISPLIMGYVWLLILKDNYGVLYSVFAFFGNGDSYINLLGDKNLAMAVVIVVNAFNMSDSR